MSDPQEKNDPATTPATDAEEQPASEQAEPSASPAAAQESAPPEAADIFPIVGIGAAAGTYVNFRSNISPPSPPQGGTGSDSPPFGGSGGLKLTHMASAGGLEALEQFLTALPPDSGMAFVLIVHLAPDHRGMMSDTLQKYTTMPVVEIEDGMAVAPNSVYVIVPNADVGLMRGTLHLLAPDMPRGRRAPVDYFFRTLADEQGERAIAIILSGTGGNGSVGLKAVKGANGMVMAQAPETAKYEGMPRSAIATGLVDYILPPAEMPGHLIEYVTDFEVKLTSQPLTRTPQNQAALQKVFMRLRDETGHDFSAYKQSTVERRLQRRMAVQQIESQPGQGSQVIVEVSR